MVFSHVPWQALQASTYRRRCLFWYMASALTSFSFRSLFSLLFSFRVNVDPLYPAAMLLVAFYFEQFFFEQMARSLMGCVSKL